MSNSRFNVLNFLETLYLFGMFGTSIYLGITLLFLVGHRDEGISQWYILLYGVGAWFCTLYFGITMILSAMRIPEERYFDFGMVAERDNYRFLSSVSTLVTGKSNFWIDSVFRIGPHVMFIVFTLMLAGVFGSIGYPVPNPYDAGGFTVDSATLAEQVNHVEQTYSVSPLKQAYFISVPVGFVEEGLILMLIEVMVLFLILFWYLVTKIINGTPMRVPALVHIVFIVSATLVASLGYTAVIPGFMDAHSAAYVANSAAFFKAFIFEFSGQLINQFTGVFVSWIPHVLHNFIVSYLMIAGLSIGGVAMAYYGWIVWFKRNKNGIYK